MSLDSNVIEVIMSIVKDYGQDIVSQPTKLEALLKDLFPNKQKEVFVLIASVKEGIPDMIFKSNLTEMSDIKLDNFKSNLTENYQMKDSAVDWVINLWVSIKKRMINPDLNFDSNEEKLALISEKKESQNSHIENSIAIVKDRSNNIALNQIKRKKAWHEQWWFGIIMLVIGLFILFIQFFP